MQKVCFAQPNASPYEQWVEPLSGVFCHCSGSSIGKSVGISYHELVKGISGISLMRILAYLFLLGYLRNIRGIFFLNNYFYF